MEGTSAGIPCQRTDLQGMVPETSDSRFHHDILEPSAACHRDGNTDRIIVEQRNYSLYKAKAMDALFAVPVFSYSVLDTMNVHAL